MEEGETRKLDVVSIVIIIIKIIIIIISRAFRFPIRVAMRALSTPRVRGASGREKSERKRKRRISVDRGTT